MANPVWDGLVTYVTWTASTTSTSFNVARGSGAVTVIVPTLVTDLNTNLQGLDPIDKTTWRNVESYDPGDASISPVVLTSNRYIVIPASAIGLGTFRFNNVTAQTATATILIDRIS